MARLLYLVALVGCFGSPSEGPAPELDEATPEQPIEEEVPPAEAPVAEASIPAADERSYATRWLVIVQRSSEPQAPFPKLEDLKNVAGVEVDAVRLYSSRLNGLQPCEYLVVANAYDRMEEARYFGHRLEQAGFSSEVMRAGSHAPLDSRLERWCTDQRADVSSRCPDGLHFVIAHEDGLWLDLDYDVDAVTRLADSAEEPLAMSATDPGWWATSVQLPTPAEDVATPRDVAAAVGASWHGFASAENPIECRVRGHSVVVRGTPHHRYADDATQPTCGTPRLFAQLDCSAEVAWAVPKATQLPARYTEVEDGRPSPASMAAAMVTLTGSELYQQVRSQAQSVAERAKELLTESTDIRLYRSQDGHEVLLVHGTLKAGESKPGCGSSDVSEQLVGVVDARGAVLTAFTPLSGQVESLLDLDRDGRPEVLQRQWPGMPALLGGDGGVLCRQPTGYCDSPCSDDLSRAP